MPRAARSLVIVLVAVVVVLIGAGQWQQRERIDHDALFERTLGYSARIVRDSWGVPHVFGKRDADVAYGLAYAHAEDDFATIQAVVLAVRGRLALQAGRGAAVGDYLVRLLRIWPTVDAHYASDLPAEARAVMEAYAEGLNRYALDHPEVLAPGTLPFEGRDVAAGFLFKNPFFYGLDEVLQQVNGDRPGLARTPTGSNAVAVAPRRAEDGATRLLVNSHQPYTGPVAWYEAVLQSEEGWHVAGGFFPGSPLMLHGHNEHLGWANTVNKPDLVDVYALEINPSNNDQYRLDGEWRDLGREVAWLWVRLWGPLIVPVPRVVWRSEHGPVLRTAHGDYALRYAGMEEVRGFLQLYRLNKATTLAEWQEAMKLRAIPALNFVYADEKGNIGYVYNGAFPERTADIDWSGVLPGDRGNLIWEHVLPFEQVPQLWNPPSGLLFNANATPFRASAPDDDLQPASFAPSMGIQVNHTNRSLRLAEIFGADGAISREEFRRYKFDLEYSPDSKTVALVAQMLALPGAGNTELEAAQARLRTWDHRADAANRGAALALLATEPFHMAEIDGRPAPGVRESLLEAARGLTRYFGRLDPEWGEVNRIVRGTLDLPIDGASDTLRSVWGTPQPDGRLHARAGDTLVMFVEWDRDGRLASESIHQFGSATLDDASPHYADQTPLFAQMKTRPVWFTEQQLVGNIEREYTVGAR